MLDLNEKKGLVVGVANEHSIAAGCAHAFHRAGAELALTYLDEDSRSYVQPVAQAVDTSIFEQLNVEEEGSLERLFKKIETNWGELDFVLHSIAYCPRPDLRGRIIDCSRGGFARAMDISVHSFIRMARLAEPLMPNGGSLMTVSYYGAEKVVDHYNIMGPVKAALEATVKYLAAELGPRKIRVNALSPGPIRTRAASGIDRFEEILDKAARRTPLHRQVTVEDVGAMAAFLASGGAGAISGNIAFVDSGYHIMS